MGILSIIRIEGNLSIAGYCAEEILNRQITQLLGDFLVIAGFFE
jgi:hypothetical protein